MPHVVLDPVGASDESWLYVVVEARTGVFYLQQYGGFACRQGRVEGFLVPIFGTGALEALRELFEKDFRGAGTSGYAWPDDERARLGDIITSIQYWASDGDVAAPHNLCLDESRIGDTDEAWVPVTTPDGPGVLLWSNSD